MKDERAKYLIVDVTDINKQLYHMERVFSFNDFENIYIPDKIITAKEIFDKYNIPEEFQKIIVKVNIPLFIRRHGEEYTLGFLFDMTAGKIEKVDDKKYINVSNCPLFHDNQIFWDKIRIRTELKYFKYDDVIDFLLKVRDIGYLRVYLQVIKEFFDISINLDYLFEMCDEDKDANRVLTRYRQKYSCGIRYK